MKKIIGILLSMILCVGCAPKIDQGVSFSQFDHSCLVEIEAPGYLPYTTDSMINTIESSPGFSKEIVKLQSSELITERYDVYYFLDGEKDEPIAQIYLPYEDNKSFVLSYNISKQKYLENKDRDIWCLDQVLQMFDYSTSENLIKQLEQNIAIETINLPTGDEYMIYGNDRITIYMYNLNLSVQFDVRSTNQ